MKTIVLQEPGRFELTETPDPGDPGPGEVRARVRRVGICGSDLHAYRGRQPFFETPRILGHELGVEVEAVGPEVQGLEPGDLCSVEPYLTCGTCSACRRGKTNCCERLTVFGVHADGGMREFVCLPASNLHKGGGVPVDALALVEMLGIGCHAVDRAAPEAGEWALVIGAGPIGLSTARFAQLAGARVIVCDQSAARLSFAERVLAPEASLDPQKLEESLRDLLDGELPTLVFDATGNADSMMGAFRLVANGARLVFVGLFQGEIRFDDPEFHRREVSLLSSRNAPSADFTRIVNLLECGAVDVVPWITHQATADTFVNAFPGWLDPQAGVTKGMLEF